MDEITDESFEFSDEFQNNVAPLISQFKIIPRWTDETNFFIPKKIEGKLTVKT